MDREEKKGICLGCLRVGDKVTYIPEHLRTGGFIEKAFIEHGIVKEIRHGVENAVWVVYNCAGEWDRFTDYTAAKTNLRDLVVGWV